MDPLIIGIAIIKGLLLGGLYGAIALGLSLIFGVMRVINFAHGSFLMVAMFIPYWLWQFWGINPYMSIIVTLPILFGLGYAVQAMIIAPLFKRERAMVMEPVSILMLTAGLYIVMDNIALMLFGPNFRSIQVDFALETLQFGILTINYCRLAAFIVSILLAVGLSHFLKHSRLGRAIRATALNRDAAALCGINVPRVYNLTFGMGCGILGIVGCMIIPFYYVNPTVGITFCIRSFIVVVLGGIGSIPGSIIGGLVLGTMESVAAQYVTSTSATMFSFILFIVVLISRPTGLMGKQV
jgi:branched-chain amino acid transport system permease protein